MNCNLEALNLVVIFNEPGKHGIKIQELINLFPDTTPGVFWPPEPITPATVEYPDKAVGISLVENRFQIQSRAINGNIPDYFHNALEKALKAARDRDIRAYGFNFDFTCPGLKGVKELFKIHIQTTSFQYKPGALLKLAFEKDGVLYIFELADGQPASYLHINVHHEEAIQTHLLVNEISKKLEADFKAASDLIKEVLNNV
ncbi:hypothetical protein L1766_05425 [Thermovorax subterraneus]|nr:hypothetical protein [Thermovorax subterraneus]